MKPLAQCLLSVLLIGCSSNAPDKPDFSGTWDIGSLTPLERPAEFVDQKYFTPEQAQTFAQSYDPLTKGTVPWMDHGASVEPDLRTSLITLPEDGKLPLSQIQRQQAAQHKERRAQYADFEILDIGERCIEDVVPMYPGPENNHISIVQTRDYVLVIREFMNSRRIFKFAEPDEPEQAIGLWMGISFARWDGARLVVTTRHFRDESELFGGGAGTELVESFELVEPDLIRYEYTLTDEEAFTEAWTARSHFRRSPLKRYEFACHEGNFGTMRSIFRGARMREAGLLTD